MTTHTSLLSQFSGRLRLGELWTALGERRRGFEVGTVIYLLIPYAIFFATWLRPWVAAIGLAVIAWAFRNVILTGIKKIPTIALPAKNKKATLGVITAVLLLWSFFSGAGGFAPQTGDYLKHNAISHDLMTHSWPVTYQNGNGLAYYMGYYLPTAAFGKLAGPLAADAFQLLWVAIGVVLAFYWLCRLTRKVNIWLALLLICFSGMDIIGYIIFHNMSFPPLGFLALEWATSPDIGIWQYSANTTLLYWTPQHALAGWIITAMIIAEFLEKKPRKNTLFLYSLTWFMSPLIALWMIPFLLGLAVMSIKQWKSFISFQNIVFPAFLAIVIGAFFLTNMYTQPTGLVWQYIDFRGSLVLLLFFHLLEYVIYATLIWPYVMQKETKEFKVLFGISLAMMAVMPFFMYGLYNDQLMRGSIPALFILMVLIARMLTNKGYEVRKIILTICLVIGAAVPLYEFYNHLDIGKPKQSDWGSIDNQNMDPGTRNLANQYYGDKDSFFYKYLAQ